MLWSGKSWSQNQATVSGVRSRLFDPRMPVETQANQTNDLPLQKVNAIGFMPNDSVAVQSVADKILTAGVPIAATAVQVGDRAANAFDNVYPRPTALVTTDCIETGRVAGHLAVELLPKHHKVKIVAPYFSMLKQRELGFDGVLKAAGIDYEIVASQPSYWMAGSGVHARWSLPVPRRSSRTRAVVLL